MMRVIVIIASLLIAVAGQAQRKTLAPPHIGKPFLDFELDSVDNYTKKSVSYQDLKGKWIFLDFWGENCSGCVKSLPKVNELQRKYYKKIQFVLVAQTVNGAKSTILLFNRLRDKFNFITPVSYDQNFVDRVRPDGLPTTVVINPEGMVEAITRYIDEDAVKDFISGKKPQLERAYLLSEYNPSKVYDRNIPLLLNNNGGEEANYVYRSLITKWLPSMPTSDILIRRNRLEFFAGSLTDLYRFAYFGVNYWAPRDTLFFNKYYRTPILELKDSSLFQSDYRIGKNMFCYSVSFANDVITGNVSNSMSIADKPRLKKTMQQDLENYFGFKATIEKRMVPILKLVATNEAVVKLKTKGGIYSYGQNIGNKAINATNISLEELIGLARQSIGFPSDRSIIDYTGISDKIDIKIDAIYFDDWLKELHKQGLDLVSGEKEMYVLVIRDTNKDQ